MKIVALLLVGLLGTQTIAHAAPVTPRTHKIAATLNSYGKKAAIIATDIATAVCLSMGLTLMHELGHAVTAKIAYGAPIDITLGTTEPNNGTILAQIGGLKIKGLNPWGGNTLSTDLSPAFRMQNPLKESAIMIAGPLSGALSSYTALKFIQKYCPKEFIFSKAIASIWLLNDTVFQLLFCGGEYYKSLCFFAVHLISQTEGGKQAIHQMIQNKI